MLWYHFFQRNCLSTIIWMNSTLSHYLNTTCGSKLHLMVTMYLHWLELFSTASNGAVEAFKPGDKWLCEETHRAPADGPGSTPYLFVAIVLKSAFFPEKLKIRVPRGRIRLLL